MSKIVIGSKNLSDLDIYDLIKKVSYNRNFGYYHKKDELYIASICFMKGERPHLYIRDDFKEFYCDNNTLESIINILEKKKRDIFKNLKV